MDFTYGTGYSLFSRIDARLSNITRGVSQYLIDLAIAFTPSQPPSGLPGALVVDDLHVHVWFGQDREEVGVARSAPAPYGKSFVTLAKYPASGGVVSSSFKLYLSPSAMEVIEEKRHGSDAVFYLQVRGNIKGYATDSRSGESRAEGPAWPGSILLDGVPLHTYQPELGFRDLELRIPQSEWCALLGRSGFQRSLVFEIPISVGEQPEHALKHLQEARDAVIEGRYGDVVARCRDALDSVIGNPDCPWQEATNVDARRRMSVEDSFRLSWCTTRQITHAGHHRNGAKAEFTRAMAQYVLGATNLALSLAGKERALFSKPPGPGTRRDGD
jgi:hypothetical protein